MATALKSSPCALFTHGLFGLPVPELTRAYAQSHEKHSWGISPACSTACVHYEMLRFPSMRNCCYQMSTFICLSHSTSQFGVTYWHRFPLFSHSYQSTLQFPGISEWWCLYKLLYRCLMPNARSGCSSGYNGTNLSDFFTEIGVLPWRNWRKQMMLRNQINPGSTPGSRSTQILNGFFPGSMPHPPTKLCQNWYKQPNKSTNPQTWVKT